MNLISLFLDALNQLFHNNIPPLVLAAIPYVILVAVLVLVLRGLAEAINKIFETTKAHIVPLFYNAEKQRQRTKRRNFARHVEREIQRINTQEDWNEFRFAELEAEVEAEGRRKRAFKIPFINRGYRGLRRERSLSKALAQSAERLILLEGDPGTGKSIALRFVTQKMADAASRTLILDTIIPIYINLKELERGPDETINRDLIYSFILRSLNRVNDREIEVFLEDKFEDGVQKGTWLFLFDSFDEIPDILSSTEADAIIKLYSEAIGDFMSGLNQCRGIVASRQFRGPDMLGQWSRFRIVPLSEKRRKELIRKADLRPEQILGQVSMNLPEFQSIAANPMFLGLLCNHVRSGNPFPDNAHSLFETYIDRRLNTDAQRLARRFELEPRTVRILAERVAFCMTADPNLGLSPSRDRIRFALTRQGFVVTDEFDKTLDALEFMKLGRSEANISKDDSKHFTFAHRRFQEYFATCIVLLEPQRISLTQLLLDARWRETSVIMCQTQPIEMLVPLVNEATYILDSMLNDWPYKIVDPLSILEEASKDPNIKANPMELDFYWPVNSYHLLRLLQEGFVNRRPSDIESIRTRAAQIIVAAEVKGNLLNKKWALEVAGIAPEQILLWLIRNGFKSKSDWLKGVAFRQVAQLTKIPDDIGSEVRKSLVVSFGEQRLETERFAIYAYLSRLDKPSKFISILNLLLVLPIVDLILHICVGLMLTVSIFVSPETPSGNRLLPLVSLLVIGIFFYKYISGNLLRLEAKGSGFALRFSSYAMLTTSVIWKMIGGQPISYDNVSMFIVFLLLSWAPMAMYAARSGYCVDPLWWPFVELLPIVYMVHIVRNIKNAFKKLRINIKAIVTAISVIILLVVFCIGILWSYVTITKIPVLWDIVWKTGAIFFVNGFVQPFARRYLDRTRWQKLVMPLARPLTLTEMLSIATGFRTPIYFIRTINFTRNRNLIVFTEEGRKLLTQMVVVLDNCILRNLGDKTGQKQTCQAQIGEIDESNICEWLQIQAGWRRTVGRRNSNSLNRILLDHLCILLEQANRQTLL